MLAWEEEDKSKPGFHRLGQKCVYVCGWLEERRKCDGYASDSQEIVCHGNGFSIGHGF